MRCPACHQNIRVQGKFCPKCGEQIFGLPVRGGTPDGGSPPDFSAPTGAAPPPGTPYQPPPQPTANTASFDDNFAPVPAPGGVLDIQFDDGPSVSATPTAAPASVAGKVCPYCRFPIKTGEEVQICPSCTAPHHLDCWRENGGCTTYGCQSSPQMGGAQAIAAAPGGGYQQAAYGGGGGPVPRAALALLEQELDRLATNALIFSLLWFLCGIPAIIGLLTGISVLGQIKHSGLPARSARTKAWIAVSLGGAALVGFAVWIVMAAGGQH